MDLMEHAAVCCGGILSNLKYGGRAGQAQAELLQVDDEAYPVEEWNLLARYLSGKDLCFDTPHEAKRWLRRYFGKDG